MIYSCISCGRRLDDGYVVSKCLTCFQEEARKEADERRALELGEQERLGHKLGMHTVYVGEF